MRAYETPRALRAALEARLLTTSKESGVGLDRLRRRVVFERVVSRLHAAEPGRWVLKGGMALEVRLRDRARLTKDVDLGLRDDVEPDALSERLRSALAADPFRDGFVLQASSLTALGADGGGHLTWRCGVAASLAGKRFGGLRLDISPRVHELVATDLLRLPSSLAFAGVGTAEVEVVDVHRHAAEKLHATQRVFPGRENTRVRDLVDLVLLLEHEMLAPAVLVEHLRQVWLERDGASPPARLTAPPPGWDQPYLRAAAALGLSAATLPEAARRVHALWRAATPPEPPVQEYR